MLAVQDVIDQRTGEDRKCEVCGADEFRINGCCSMECQARRDGREEATEAIVADLREQAAEMRSRWPEGWVGARNVLLMMADRYEKGEHKS